MNLFLWIDRVIFIFYYQNNPNSIERWNPLWTQSISFHINFQFYDKKYRKCHRGRYHWLMYHLTAAHTNNLHISRHQSLFSQSSNAASLITCIAIADTFLTRLNKKWHQHTRENIATFFSHFSSLQRQIIAIKLLLLVLRKMLLFYLCDIVVDDVVCLLLHFMLYRRRLLWLW